MQKWAWGYLHARFLIRHLLDDDSINQSQVNKLYYTVRGFYTKTYYCCVNWLRLDNGFVKKRVFVNSFKRNYICLHSLGFLSFYSRERGKRPKCFNNSLGWINENQSMINYEILERIWQEATLEREWYRMDVVWGNLKDRFPNLSDIAQTVLVVFVVPHSNATDERELSMITKNKTEFRSNIRWIIKLNNENKNVISWVIVVMSRVETIWSTSKVM